MTDELNLNTDIAMAVNGAADRGHTLVLGYVDAEGNAAVSFRGSTHVHSPTQLAIWARKTSEGFAGAIANHPRVTLLYYASDGPGASYLSFQGTARVDASQNDAVYQGMSEAERKQDSERKGVAVIIDIDTVSGFGSDGPFRMERAPA